MSPIKEKVRALKERLLDPFSVDGLDREFEELLSCVQKAEPDELLAIRDEFEEVKALLSRNLEIISGGLKPLLRKGQGSFFSRRV